MNYMPIFTSELEDKVQDHLFCNPSHFGSIIVGIVVGKSTYGGKIDALHFLPEKSETSFRVTVNLVFQISGAHSEILK